MDQEHFHAATDQSSGCAVGDCYVLVKCDVVGEVEVRVYEGPEGGEGAEGGADLGLEGLADPVVVYHHHHPYHYLPHDALPLQGHSQVT